jgi:hypothetical protein
MAQGLHEHLYLSADVKYSAVTAVWPLSDYTPLALTSVFNTVVV